MKKNTKLLCKIDFVFHERRFFANKHYIVFETANNYDPLNLQIYVLAEDGNGLWFSTNHELVINPTQYSFPETCIWNYFYTIEEVRKMKLDKIENINEKG